MRMNRSGRKMVLRLLLSCFSPSLFLGLAFGAGPIQVDDNFESGSLGEWRIEDETRLIFVPRKEHDQDRVNTAVTWFYGKLSNVLNREVEIVLDGLDYTVYNGKRGDILPFERNTVPVFSYDRKHWERFSSCGFVKEERVFRIRQIFSRDAVWIAYVPPYTFSRLESLVNELKSNPSITIESIGDSVEGRPLYLVTAADPNLDQETSPVVWIVARQHSFEAGGSWAVEGLLNFLTSSELEARKILQKAVFKICPMLNPDGVVSGGTRFNARGVDLNRHWDSDDPLSGDYKKAPEIVSVKEALRQWKRRHRLDLWINIHNNDMVWNNDGDYIRFAPADKEEAARRLEETLRQKTIFTGPFILTPNSSTTEAVVAKEFGALSLLMEMKTGYLDKRDRWTGVDLFLLHGEGTARSAATWLELEE